jgi:transposase
MGRVDVEIFKGAVKETLVSTGMDLSPQAYDGLFSIQSYGGRARWQLKLMDKSIKSDIIEVMAHRKFELSEQERGELRQAYDGAKDTRFQQRVQAVRLYGEGRGVSDIAAIVGGSERSLLRWCEHYRQAGIVGLVSGWRGGNNARLTAAQRAEVVAKIKQYQPNQLLPSEVRVSRGTFWTVSDLQIGIQRWYGVTWRSNNSYRSLLAEAGLSLQQTENTYRSRPDDLTIAHFEAGLEKK